MPTDCLLCAIADGDAKVNEVYRGDGLVAFLDIGPIRPGHTLIIPMVHVPYFDDMPSEMGVGILALGQRIAKAQKKLYGVQRVAFFFTGGDIAHVHAHVVPMHEKTDLTSRRYIAEQDLTFRPIPTPGDACLDAVAAELRQCLQQP